MFFITKRRYFALVISLIALLFAVTLVGFMAATIVTLLLLIVLTYPLMIVWHTRHYRTAENYEKAFHVQLEGDVNLGLLYYKPPVSNKTPVILCHGLAANHRFFDLSSENSLAQYLADAGYDVYSLDLRGAGLSRSPGGFSDFKFSDLVGDLEPVIDTVLKHANRRSKQKQVVYIGHSLGAMIMYKYLEQNSGVKKQRIKTFISLSGPTQLSSLAHPVITDLLKVSRFANRINIKKAGQIFAPLVGIFPSRYDDFLYNKHAIDRAQLKVFMAHGISNVAPALALQLLNAVVSRKNDLTFDLGKIKVPTLMMTGTQDNLCTPLDMQLAFTKIGTAEPHKRLVLLGKIYGFQVDYCHGSIVLGKHARGEVFSIIKNWLREYT